MRLRVVLVEPLYDGNVGSVARAMKNFGFHELCLVNPCRIGDFGLAMASHAGDVLHRSRSFTSLAEALHGCDLVIGTTGKRLDRAEHHHRVHLRAPYLTPREMARRLRGMDGTAALLLGREDCGLNSEELSLCDMLVSIPTDADYPVMNLSHSAAVLLYELSLLNEMECGFVEIAREESLSLLRERTDELLDEVRYPAHKLDFTLLMLRRIFGRAGLTEREARTILGIMKRITWRIKNADAVAEQERLGDR